MWAKLAIVKSHSGDGDFAYFSDHMEPEFGMTQFIEKENFKPWELSNIKNFRITCQG